MLGEAGGQVEGSAEKSTWEEREPAVVAYEIRFCEKSLWAKMDEAGPAIG